MTLYSNALSGVLGAQCGLDASSTNVANLKTEGFSRRAVEFGALQGGGVETSDAFRYNDSYKDRQLWKASTALGAHDAAKTYYDQIEAVFGGDASTLQDHFGMQRFFSALRAVSVDPTSAALRDGVLHAAEGMTQHFSEVLGTMRNQLDTLEHQRIDTVAQVGTLARQIAGLNQQIMIARAGRQDVNAMLDARDHAIDAMSRLADLQVLPQRNGAVDVSLAANGQPLVVGDTAAVLSVDALKGGQQIAIHFGPQVFQVLSDRIGGVLGGLREFEATALRPQMRNLIDLSQQFAHQFNAQLAAGYDQSGRPGKPLFVFDKTTSRFRIDASLQASDLAFSGARDQPADTTNLVKLIGLKGKPISLSGIGSVAFGGAEAAMIGALGEQSYKNTAAYDTAGKVRQQAVTAWQSVSGVNGDEEAARLLAYQQMYQANMKCISVCRDLFQTLMQSL